MLMLSCSYPLLNIFIITYYFSIIVVPCPRLLSKSYIEVLWYKILTHKR